MVFVISTPSSSLLHASSSPSSAGVQTSRNCYFSNPKYAIFQHIKCIPQLGITHFSQWNGLKHIGISISQHSVKIERKGKCKGKGVYASLFGVGAPEVLVTGVVALLVFGPKGLAEVARNLGKAIRAFQPTIRELQEVSREFKSTLEREIGLDDIDKPVPKSSSSDTTKPKSENMSDNSGKNIEPNDSLPENGEDSTDDYLKARADRFRGALAQLQKEQEEEKEREEVQSEAVLQTPSQDAQQEASSVTPPSEDTDNSAYQEAASVVMPTVPAPQTDIQT